MDKNKTHNLRKAIMLAERMGLKKTTVMLEGLEEAGRGLHEGLRPSPAEEAAAIEFLKNYDKYPGGEAHVSGAFPYEKGYADGREAGHSNAALQSAMRSDELADHHKMKTGGAKKKKKPTAYSDIESARRKGMYGEGINEEELEELKGSSGGGDKDHPGQTCMEAHGDDPSAEGHAKYIKQKHGKKGLSEEQLKKAIREAIKRVGVSNLKKKFKNLNEGMSEKVAKNLIAQAMDGNREAINNIEKIDAETMSQIAGQMTAAEKSLVHNINKEKFTLKVLGLSGGGDASEEDMRRFTKYMAKELEGDVEKSREMLRKAMDKRERDPRDRMNITGLEDEI